MRGTPSSGFGGKLPRPDGARRRDGSAREKSGISRMVARGGRPVASPYPFFFLPPPRAVAAR
jgi:hypothetical protein